MSINKSLSNFVLNAWAGRISNADPHYIAQGVQSQDNIQCLQAGVLTVRPGMRLVSWAAPISFSDERSHIGLFRYQSTCLDRVIYMDAWGEVKAATVDAIATPWARQTIIDRQHPYMPPWMEKTRNGELVFLTGMDRGRKWDGMTALAEDLGIDAPASPPTLTESGGGSIADGNYWTGYRYVDDAVPTPIPSSLSGLTPITVSQSGSGKITHSGFTPVAIGGQRDRVQSVEIYRSLMGNSITVYRVAVLPASGTFTKAESFAGNVMFTAASGHGIVVGCLLAVTSSMAPAFDVTYTVTAVSATTITTATPYPGATADPYTFSTPAVWTLDGYNKDTASGTTLISNQKLPIFNPDGSLNARRFVPPPSFKRVCIEFQDRMLYLVDMIFDEGTITTNGTTTVSVSGVNTASISLSHFVGQYLTIPGEVRPFLITGSTSTTWVVDVAPAASAAGLGYCIAPHPVERNTLYFSEVDEYESVPATNQIVIQENLLDHDHVTGAVPHGSVLYVFTLRHAYRLTFVKQPQIDTNLSLAFSRGLINARCVAQWEDDAYCLDQAGIYAFTMRGSDHASRAGVLPISEPIDDIFQKGIIDWSQSKWFYAQVEPERSLIRWHVSYVGDGTTRPSRTLVYNTRLKMWWTESTIGSERGGGCMVEIDGRLRVLSGGQDDGLWLLGEGTSDGVSSVIESTVTSATNASLTDSSQSWTTNEFRNSTVTILSGTGAGQIRRVNTNSDKVLSLAVGDTWATDPDTTSVYAIGAVAWSVKTGLRSFLDLSDTDKSQQGNLRGCQLSYLPAVAGEMTCQIERYLNHDLNPKTYSRPEVVQNVTYDTAATINMKREFVTGYSSPGVATLVDSGGRLDTISQGDRWVSYRLSGYQKDEVVTLYSLTFFGVQE